METIRSLGPPETVQDVYLFHLHPNVVDWRHPNVVDWSAAPIYWSPLNCDCVGWIQPGATIQVGNKIINYSALHYLCNAFLTFGLDFFFIWERSVLARYFYELYIVHQHLLATMLIQGGDNMRHMYTRVCCHETIFSKTLAWVFFCCLFMHRNGTKNLKKIGRRFHDWKLV